MKILVPFFILATLLACTKDGSDAPTSDLTINFKASFGSEPLTMFSSFYPYENEVDVKLQLFQFYISDVTLIKHAHNSHYEKIILDVASVDFGEIYTAQQAAQGISFLVKDVPTGDYTGIKIGIGVAPDLNATGPASYPPGHPLTENYWSWAMGYVFFKIEGNADLDQTGQFAQKLTFHIGTNEMYRVKEIEKRIKISESNPVALDFVVDAKRVLTDGKGNFVDFRKVNQDHTNNKALGHQMADNLLNAISFSIE
jgi:hypothetical protein